MRTVIIVLLGGVLAATLAACSEDESRVSVELQPIRDLAVSAEREATEMEEHTNALAEALGGHAHADGWSAEVDSLRASVQSLRLLARWAEAIHHDRGSRSREATELIRLVGHGRNLQQLGATLVAHADAMEAHLERMRQAFADDPELAPLLGHLHTDLDGMRSSGRGAQERGRELEESALQFARGLGIPLN